MAAVAKTFGECKERHPDVWELGTEIGDATYDTRSDYIIAETRINEARSRYIRIAGEQLVSAIFDGTFEDLTGVPFPDPVTKDRAVCFGIALQKQITDRYDDDR